MIYTGNYKNCLQGNLISISGDRGKKASYTGTCFPSLAPKLSFWKIWHDNIGKISDEENNYFYIKEYYEQVLKKLDASYIYEILDGSILLCYEGNLDFCHRHIVAFWLEKELQIDVPEIKLVANKMEIINRPQWIQDVLYDLMDEKKYIKKGV